MNRIKDAGKRARRLERRINAFKKIKSRYDGAFKQPGSTR